MDFGEACHKMNQWGNDEIPFMFILDFELEKPQIYPLAEIPKTIRFSTPRHPLFPPVPYPGEPFMFEKVPVAYQVYEDAFNLVSRGILHGDSYLLNLTYPTSIETGFTLEQIFRHSAAPYRLWVEDRFVVFSPESFIQISDGLIRSFPMKGTIDASLPDAEQRVLEDPKERAEHFTIVDLIRNDLSRVAREVSVPRFRYVEAIETYEKRILQVSSEVTGRLPDQYPAMIGSILKALLPAGSVSGAPKKKTIEIIRSAEGISRGYYTGIFGIFDGKVLESAVMIRYIEQVNGKLWFRSGGGITHLSDPRHEYQEMIDKVYVSFA